MQEREYSFSGDAEGTRKARWKFGLAWASYLAHLAGFFVAPFALLVSENRLVNLLGLAGILAISLLDILPQALKVAWDKGLDLGEGDRIYSLYLMMVLLGGATLMVSELTRMRAVGAFVWIIVHLFTLGGPPRMVKEYH